MSPAAARGELIGVGSLQLERERNGKSETLNMVVPIDLLKPIIQPGGSKRDDEVIVTVSQHNATMVFTHRRHFRH